MVCEHRYLAEVFDSKDIDEEKDKKGNVTSRTPKKGAQPAKKICQDCDKVVYERPTAPAVEGDAD